MNGFFTKSEISLKSGLDSKSRSCYSCGLYKNCISPKIKPYGNFKKKILNLGEAPGEMEDKNGRPWQGRTGKLLQRSYDKIGIDLFDDCLNINSVNCFPVDDEKEGRTPTNFEIDNCRQIVMSVIQEFKPEIIVLFGNSAVYSVIGNRWKNDLEGITKWRGWRIPDQDYKCWIIPTFHPSFVERDETNVSRTVWMQDLQEIKNTLNMPFFEYREPDIEIIENLKILDKMPDKSVIAIDYETTGVKPYAEGHEIICCAVADADDHAYVFMVPEDHRQRKPLIDLLTNEKIAKVGQHIKFEEIWSIKCFHQSVINWMWDTMLASHILDNRRGITGLKFQSYVQFGIIDYASDIEPYLTVDNKKSANSFNNIRKLVSTEEGEINLMKYCGIDAVHTLRLALRQMEFIQNMTLPF